MGILSGWSSGAQLEVKLGVQRPPSTFKEAQKALNGAPLDIACQVQGGTNIGGNATWDKLATGEWVADHYTTTPSFNSYAPGLGACKASGFQVRTMVRRTVSSRW